MAAAEPAPTGGPIAWIIGTCARNPGLTLLLVAASAALGIYSIRHVPLDAIPDLSDVQVIVYSEWPGRSAELVEDQITYPISSKLLAAPGVRAVRGQSFFGVSFVYAIFDDSTDLYWARSSRARVHERRPERAAERRHAGDRPRRHGRRLGLRVRAGRSQRHARPRRAAQPAGLEPALRAGLGSGRRRSRVARRAGAPVPDPARPGRGSPRSAFRPAR